MHFLRTSDNDYANVYSRRQFEVRGWRPSVFTFGLTATSSVADEKEKSRSLESVNKKIGGDYKRRIILKTGQVKLLLDCILLNMLMTKYKRAETQEILTSVYMRLERLTTTFR